MNHVNVKELQRNLIEANQSVVSLKNIARQFHNLAFLALMELRIKDKDNRIFFNGYVSTDFLTKIDVAIKASKEGNVPVIEGTHEAYKGDMKPGIAPESFKK